MKNTTAVQVDLNGKLLTIETGLLARQADGSVTVQFGDTILSSATTASKKINEALDYFPLQVEYREKFYAAGRFPGGYFKREARPSEKEILAARATDRPIRPLFPPEYRNELQIINELLCVDNETAETDALSITAASAALTLSEIPFQGPIAAVRVARVKGEWKLNPAPADTKASDLNLLYAGTRDMMLMIEGTAQEISDADIVAAMKYAHTYVVRLVDAQLELRRKRGLPDKVVTPATPDLTLINKARELAATDLAAALRVPGKQARDQKLTAVRVALQQQLLAAFPDMTDSKFKNVFDHLEIELVRHAILNDGKRMDGRGCDDIRPLYIDVGLLPRTHGSALFNRGETQALATVTLGTVSDAQTLDLVAGGPDEKRFMLHYNFPPYSTGEVKRIGGTGRREIGHGALAERSLLPMMPADYPYTVRIVSEIMGSNGSSSMASICAGTLALMDAGVPLRKPVAGISIGLVTGATGARLLTDIIGAEDHCGDMDFKVAGTREGITGFQVDLKIPGLAWDLVEGAFAKARAARGKILDAMAQVIAQPRAELSKYAPRIHTMRIDPDKIGALIGPGGKNIRRITDTLGVQIDVEDDGTVAIFSWDKTAMEAAVREIEALTGEPEVGKIYNGRVTGVKEFGAFVEVMPGIDGLCHISQLAEFRVNTVEEICKIGDAMWVKCIGIDDRGKIKLSRKDAMRERDQAAGGDAKGA